MTTRRKRILKSEFGPRKISLPASLSFLDAISFQAVLVTTTETGRKQYSVEMNPAFLKRQWEKVKSQQKAFIALGSAKNAKNASIRRTKDEEIAVLHRQGTERQAELEALKVERDALANEIAELRMKNKLIQHNLDIISGNESSDGTSTNVSHQGRIKSHLGVALDNGFIPHGLAMQGGLPGSKKR